MTRLPAVLLVAGLAASAVAAAGAQDPPQTQRVFRAGTTTVPVYVTVNDRSGGFVTDLRQQDFEVRDNGKPQEIKEFTTDAQPLSTLILIDGSSSMMDVLNNVIEAANTFIIRMAPGDRTAIASFADKFQMRQPFSPNRDELLAHLKDEFNIRVATETRLWDSLAEGLLAFKAETSGRRVIVTLSDGKNWVANQQRGFSGSGPRDILGMAIDRDVMLYAIAVWTKFEGRAERPDNDFQLLASDTGGGYVEMKESDDVNALMSQVSRELHQQYVLGFTPQVLDGKVHKLDVKVLRPNVEIRARRSYVAPKGSGF